MRVYYLPTASLWNDFMAVLIDAGSKRIGKTEENILECHHILVESFADGYGHSVLKPSEVKTCIKVDEAFMAQVEFLSNDDEVLLTWLTQN